MFSDSIKGQKLIAVIRDNLRRFEDNEYQRLLSQMSAWLQPTPPKPSDDDEDSGGKKPTKVNEPKVEYISSKSVKVDFDKAWLADESDVEEYLKSMKEALLEEIKRGKRIQI